MRRFHPIGILTLLAGLCLASLSITAQAENEPNFERYQYGLQQAVTQYELVAVKIDRSDDVQADFQMLYVSTYSNNRKAHDRNCSDPDNLLSRIQFKQFQTARFAHPSNQSLFEVGWLS